MKKALCALMALMLILSLGQLALGEGENLLTNGDFSDVKGDLPRGWRRDMWLTDTGVSVLTVDEAFAVLTNLLKKEGKLW